MYYQTMFVWYSYETIKICNCTTKPLGFWKQLVNVFFSLQILTTYASILVIYIIKQI